MFELHRELFMSRYDLAKLVFLWVVMHLVVTAAFASQVHRLPFVISSSGAELLVRIDRGAGGEGRFLRKPEDSDNSFATYFRWDAKSATYVYYMTATLPQPVLPHRAHINGAGYLVTIGNCVNRSWLPAIGILSPNGVLVKSYELGELYEREVLDTMPWTKGTEIGLCSGWLSEETPVSMGSKSVRVTDGFGKTFDFELSDGSFEYR